MTDHAIRSRIWPPSRRAHAGLVAGTLVALLAGVLVTASGSRADEVDRLSDLLQLREGMTVAEIGAGTGWLTVAVARVVGPSGRVYATELSRRRLDDIRDAVAEACLTQVIVVPGADTSTNLPRGCCDTVFMRRVYHHVTDPAAITADLYEALVPGGRLVIIEFDARRMLGLVTRMGIDQARLVTQVTATGFDLLRVDAWPSWGHYVAVFEKPGVY